jgi:hypothetical protein
MRHYHLGTNTGFERVGILRTCVFDCLLSNGTSRGSVSTIRTVAAQAEAFGCKAFAVQLETLGLFTVAHTSFRWGRLFLILFAGWWRNGAKQFLPLQRSVPWLLSRSRVVRLLSRHGVARLGCGTRCVRIMMTSTRRSLSLLMIQMMSSGLDGCCHITSVGRRWKVMGWWMMRRWATQVLATAAQRCCFARKMARLHHAIDSFQRLSCRQRTRASDF